MNTLSVLTLAKGRPAHLVNMMLGLARQSILPHELIIAVMQDSLYDDLPRCLFRCVR